MKGYLLDENLPARLRIVTPLMTLSGDLKPQSGYGLTPSAFADHFSHIWTIARPTKKPHTTFQVSEQSHQPIKRALANVIGPRPVNAMIMRSTTVSVATKQMSAEVKERKTKRLRIREAARMLSEEPNLEA